MMNYDGEYQSDYTLFGNTEAPDGRMCPRCAIVLVRTEGLLKASDGEIENYWYCPICSDKFGKVSRV